MDGELVVLYFETPAAAEHGLSTLRQLDAEGFIDIEACAIVKRDADGSVSAKNADEHEVGKAATFGGVLGLFVGGVVGLPVLGVLAGAGVAAHRTSDADRLEELISNVGQQMAPGTAVLALSVVEIGDPETVTDRLAVDRDGLLRADVPASLRSEIERSLGE